MLARAGIHTAEDLLRYKPFRYEDRTNFRQIRELKADEEAVVQAEVAVTGRYTTSMKRMQIFEMLVKDDSGNLAVKFFNQPYLERVFRKGQTVILYGTPRADSFSRGISMISPEYEILEGAADLKIHTGRIVPIYRRIGQITTRSLRQVIFQLLNELPDELQEPLPDRIRKKYQFPDRRAAFQEIHFPSPPEGASRDRFLEQLLKAQAPAHQRFIFEEFFLFQFGLLIVRQQRKVLPKARRIQVNDGIRQAIKRVLPFRPTQAQKRVLREIVDDLCSPKIMNRLLQGDVGSGKTIVALQAMIVVIENQYQAALMAPTEILAEQHYRNISGYLKDSRWQVALFTSQIKGKKRKTLLSQIQSGEINVIIGTHTLIQGGVDFKALGIVVIDEQHRFGVIQRSQLVEKGDQPETLVMTATPIPRSLALTVYGDLELSVLDEMPPGRQPVKTVVKAEKSRPEVYDVIRRELKKGRQAFVIYPLIEESEKVDLRAATKMSEHLQEKVFPDFRIGLLHGRLKAEEKEELMNTFRSGKIHLLVATTVVEVGIDIPNATVMVVEHAERFGLSQLHQLRGRIGRGADPGLCILMTEGVRSRNAFERLDIMRKTSDGFEIAEKDLEIRGPGEFVGTRQSGIPEFMFGNIVRDRKLLELARQDAESYLKECLKGRPGQSPQQILAEVASWWKERYGLYTVG